MPHVVSHSKKLYNTWAVAPLDEYNFPCSHRSREFCALEDKLQRDTENCRPGHNSINDLGRNSQNRTLYTQMTPLPYGSHWLSSIGKCESSKHTPKHILQDCPDLDKEREYLTLRNNSSSQTWVTTKNPSVVFFLRPTSDYIYYNL